MDLLDEPRLPGVVVLRDPVGWPAVVAGYLAEISPQKSPNTTAAYRRDIADWTARCAVVDVDPLQAGRADVIAYLEQLNRRGLSPSTMKRRLTSLRGVYGWAIGEELLDRSPAARVKGPPVPSTSPTLGLDIDQVGDLLEAARCSSPLEHALVWLLFANGLRAEEVCSADVADLHTVLGRRAIRVRRKGGKEAVEALSQATAAAVDAHLGDRRTGALFYAPGGLRMHRQQVRRLVIRLASAAGIHERITTHSLRHTFVTQGLEAGATLEALQDAAGHADPATTRRYDRARHQLAKHPTHAVSDFLESSQARRHSHGHDPESGTNWSQLPAFEESTS